MVVVLATAGCTSAREKDCKALLPLAEEAAAARNLAPPSLDAGTGPITTTFAARPRRSADALRQAATTDAATNAPASALANAMAHYATALETVDRTVAALSLRPMEGTLSPDAINGVAEAAAPLFERCGLILRTERQKALPECAALEAAVATCLTPRTDDATAEEQLLGCATAVEGVRSADASTSGSVRRLGEALRRIEPLARSVGVPAKQATRLVTDATKAMAALPDARAAAERADADLRAVCAAR